MIEEEDKTPLFSEADDDPFGASETPLSPEHGAIEELMTRHGTKASGRTSLTVDFDAIQANLQVAHSLITALPTEVTVTSLLTRHPDGKVTATEVGSGLMVGRRDPADLVIAAPELSSAHFSVGPRDDSEFSDVLIEDLSSKNGTWLNRQRLHHPMRLKAGDLVEAGGLRFTLLEAPEKPDEG